MAKYWRCTLNSISQGNLNKSHHLCKKTKPAWLNDHDGRSWKQILETKVEWEGWIISPAECTLSCRLVDIRPCYRRQFNLSVRRRRKRPTVVSKEQLTNDSFIVSCLWVWQNHESGSTKRWMHPEKIHCRSDVEMKKTYTSISLCLTFHIIPCTN